MPKKPNNFFAGIPKDFFRNFFPKRNPKKFAGFGTSTLFFKNFFPKRNSTNFFKPKKNFQDNSRVKYIKQTKRDTIRYRLEQQAYFPQENEGLVDIFKKTFLHYFLPFPPPPPLEDPRNIFPENKKGSQR